MKSHHPCTILLKERRTESKRERRKESKGKIKRMKLKPLSGTQLDITSDLAASAGNTNLARELGRDERRVVRLPLQR